jgi:hypothetical protein
VKEDISHGANEDLPGLLEGPGKVHVRIRKVSFPIPFAIRTNNLPVLFPDPGVHVGYSVCHALSVAMIAPRADLMTTDDGVPSCIGPFNFRFLHIRID